MDNTRKAHTTAADGAWTGSLDGNHDGHWSVPWALVLPPWAVLIALRAHYTDATSPWLAVAHVIVLGATLAVLYRHWPRWQRRWLVRRHGPDLQVRLVIALPRVTVQVAGDHLDTTVEHLRVERTALDAWRLTDTRDGRTLEVRGSLFPAATRREPLARLAMLAEHAAGLRNDRLDPLRG